MIATVSEMADEAEASPALVRAELSRWSKRGWAKFTGRTVPSQHGLPTKMWEVRDYVWGKFLARKRRPQ